jgi:uncharacterized membrane protein YkvA (DUF1232 family)
VSLWYWLLASVGVALAVYVVFITVLIVVGRKDTARAVARFVPDCIVLFRRLLADPRVPRRKKFVLAALIAYLALPFDLVPDFIPIAGYLDDAIIVAFVLRYVLRGSDRELIERHRPGPNKSLGPILRLAGYASDEREAAAAVRQDQDERPGVESAL